MVQEGINFQVENSIVQIPVTGYYYIYISAGVCATKPVFLSVVKNGERIFGLTRTTTNHNGLDTIGHGMVLLLSENDRLWVDSRYTDFCTEYSGLHTSFLGMLLYED